MSAPTNGRSPEMPSDCASHLHACEATPRRTARSGSGRARSKAPTTCSSQPTRSGKPSSEAPTGTTRETSPGDLLPLRATQLTRGRQLLEPLEEHPLPVPFRCERTTGTERFVDHSVESAVRGEEVR